MKNMIEMEKPYKYILDRELFRDEISKRFSAQLLVIEDMVNYGTALIPRCYKTSGHELTDTILIIKLLKGVVCMLDAIHIALRECAVIAATLPLRALWERRLSLKWMLKEDTELRAAIYYVTDLKDMLKMNERITPGSSSFNEFKSRTKGTDTNIFKNFEEISKEVQEGTAKIKTILSQPEYATPCELYEKRVKKGRSPNWYELTGPTSIANLAAKLGLAVEYEFLYKSASKLIHGNTLYDEVSFDGEKVIFEPIRNPEDFYFILGIACNCAFDCYMSMIDKYRPQERELLERKYNEKWKKPLANIPKEECEYDPMVEI
jgi:hypothetical protein